ncbi:MAG: hypothetical protein IPH45_16955 [Bacteroidales bacterium]|nr:hypothetical protein [Bacteroidales bacterium]
MIRYMVVCEWEREGFVLAMLNNLDEAERLAMEVFDMSNSLNADDYLAYLELRVPVRYHINGNMFYCLVGSGGSCDGFVTTIALTIDTQTFCLKTFLKTRENHSTVFEYDDEPEKLDFLAAKFPKFCACAN